MKALLADLCEMSPSSVVKRGEYMQTFVCALCVVQLPHLHDCLKASVQNSCTEFYGNPSNGSSLILGDRRTDVAST